MKIKSMIGTALVVGALAGFSIPALANEPASSIGSVVIATATPQAGVNHGKCGHGKCKGKCGNGSQKGSQSNGKSKSPS